MAAAARDDLAVKRPVEAAVVLQPQLAHQPLGREIAAGSVVLMQRMHGHAVARGSGRLGQRVAKGVMPRVGNPDPIDRAEDDRLFRAEQHDAATAERQFAQPLDRIIGHCRAQGRSGIDVKHGQLDGRFGGVNGDGRNEQEDGGETSESESQYSTHRGNSAVLIGGNELVWPRRRLTSRDPHCSGLDCRLKRAPVVCPWSF